MTAWTVDDLVRLRRTSRLLAGCWDLNALARQVGRGRDEVDVALAALVGRTPAEAAAALAAPPSVPEGKSHFPPFLQRLFG